MSRAAFFVAWNEVPHLTEESKQSLLAGIPAFQREARTKGVPQLGSGSIYPVLEDEFVIAPREIPPHWPRVFGLDVGFKRTAAVFAAIDRDTGALYIYDEIYRGEAEPVVVAADIKRRGGWLPGVCDPAANGRSQIDGRRLLDLYTTEGLDITKADNSVEAGIFAVWQRMSTGGLKVFSTCKALLAELRIYRRNEKGVVVKANDHACDALRYLVMSGLERAITEPTKGSNTWWKTPTSKVWAG